MKHKIGDKVKVKSQEWYEKNKNPDGAIVCENGWHFSNIMQQFCGKELIVKALGEEVYRMADAGFYWTDDMLEENIESPFSHTFKPGTRYDDIATSLLMAYRFGVDPYGNPEPPRALDQSLYKSFEINLKQTEK